MVNRFLSHPAIAVQRALPLDLPRPSAVLIEIANTAATLATIGTCRTRTEDQTVPLEHVANVDSDGNPRNSTRFLRRIRGSAELTL
jgi:hypothetical protein